MRRLGLNKRQALFSLDMLAKQLPVCGSHDFSVVLDNKYDIGDGYNANFRESEPDAIIDVGINGLAGKGRYGFSKVDDLKFVQALVTLYHEYDHYLQNYGANKDLNCMVSEVSVYGNPTYYINNWSKLPHEIHAEAAGVLGAWNAMQTMFPNVANECMLEYVNYRSTRTTYMIPPKYDAEGQFVGYKSFEEVMDAFDMAGQASLCLPRTPHRNFLFCDDESIQLVKQGFRDYKASKNAYHADKLIDRMPGMQKDRMMASLVLTLRPELLNDYPELKQVDLSVESVFGKPLVKITLPEDMSVQSVETVTKAKQTGNRDVSDLGRLLGEMPTGLNKRNDGPDF